MRFKRIWTIYRESIHKFNLNSFTLKYPPSQFGVVPLYLCLNKAKEMKPIMSLIYELNSLCELYDTQIDDSLQKQRIRQIFTELVKQGYKIVRPRFNPSSEEFKRLSDNGKLISELLILVHSKKQEAIDTSQFEFAANLRDWERDLKRTIKNDFSKAITNRIFVLKSDETKEIIYNDSNGKLKEIFNLT